MITINNKQYRNLEEQVRFLTEQYNVNQGIAEWGIRVLGVLDSAEELPDADTYKGEYGNTYAVGTEEPYDFYIWTRSGVAEGTGFWFDVGSIAIAGPVGPAGPEGPRGEKGERGSRWFSGTGKPTTTSGYLEGDYYINVSNNENRGNIWHLHKQDSNLVWLLEGNIRGPQGLPGLEGKQGKQGEQGPKGDRGAPGPVGATVQILGTITSIDQLPDPATVPRNGAYLNTSSTPAYLYVISGTDTLAWMDAGPFNTGTMVTEKGEYLTTWDTSIKLDNMNNRTGGYWTTYSKFFDRFYPLAEVGPAGSKNYTWHKAINKSQGGEYPSTKEWSKVQRGDPVVRTASGNIVLPPDIEDYHYAAVHKQWVLQNTQPARSNYFVNGWVTFPSPVVTYDGYIDYPDYTNNEGVSDVSENFAEIGNVKLYFNNAVYDVAKDATWDSPFTFFENVDLSKSAANLACQFEGEIFPVHNLGYYYDSDSNTECFRIVITYAGAQILNLLWYMYEGDGEVGQSAEEVFSQPTLEIA